MRFPPIFIAGLLLATPAVALAAPSVDVEGSYAGAAACPGGEVEIKLSLAAVAGDAFEGSLQVLPRNGAKVAADTDEVSGTIDGDDRLEITGPGKVLFSGMWFDTDADGDVTIMGDLEDAGCESFTLIRGPKS